MFLIIIILSFLLQLSSNDFIKNDSPAVTRFDLKEMEVGEELTYVVRYSFIKLGEIKLKVIEKKENNNSIYFRTIANMDSYPEIPFVYLHQIYESDYNIGNYSQYFKSIQKEKNGVFFTEYNYDYPNKKVDVQRGRLNPKKIEIDTSHIITDNYQDGLSIFYFARMNSGKSKTVKIKTLINEDIVSATINFQDKIEPIEIDAVDYEISCNYLSGKADFVGIFGLTGNFEGWFTNDKFAIPVLAKLKVIIGSVTVELIKWRKKDWNPPKY